MTKIQNGAEWTWNEDYSIAWAPTTDPRVLAVILRDDEPGPPDGDALAPAYWLDYPHNPRPAGYTYQDDESARIAEAWQNAHAYAVNHRRYYHENGALVERYPRIFHEDEFAERYLRIFHDTAMAEVVRGSERILILDTPTYREHITNNGGPDAANLEGDVHEWTAYIVGDVYGVGYAVNEGRVLDNAPIDFNDFTVEPQCWGFYGEDYAKEEALEMEYGEPELPTMLTIEEG